MINLMMVCSYQSFYIDLPVTIVGFQVEGCPSRLHHICQGGYVVFNDIYFDGAEQKICCNCVDKLWGQVKS